MAKTAARSRRVPKLRVVGAAHPTPRHVGTFQMSAGAAAGDWIMRVLTFAEWDKLEPWERPDENYARRITGIGYIVIDRPRDDDEMADVRDLRAQERENYQMMSGEL
jgi:hypothetical protein